MSIWRSVVVVALLGCNVAAAEIAATEGWHTWRVGEQSDEVVQFYVLVENGKPARIFSTHWNCRQPAKAEAIDHGVIAAAESYEWFRAVVEDAAVDRDIRDAALFGLVESGTDEAIAYIDRILSRR